jgi:hypothetical protein
MSGACGAHLLVQFEAHGGASPRERSEPCEVLA